MSSPQSPPPRAPFDPAPPTSGPFGTGARVATARLGGGVAVPGLVWAVLLCSAVGFGIAGRVTIGSPGPHSPTPTKAAAQGAASRADPVLRQAVEWERVYRQIHPMTMTEPEVAYYRAWQRQYEQQHPQD